MIIYWFVNVNYSIKKEKYSININIMTSPNKNTKKKIKGIKFGKTRKRDNRKIWNGSGFDVLFGLVYLLNKYNDLCVPIKNANINLLSFMVGFFCKQEVKYAKHENDYVLSIPDKDNFVDNIKKCSKNHRFLCVPVYIGSSSCSSLAHMNVLLIDNKEQKIYRFESYGQYGFTPRSLKIYKYFDKRFEEWLKMNKLNYSYEAFRDCPNIGPQELEERELEMSASTAYEDVKDPGGFCGVWGIYFIDVMLRNPELTKRDVFNKIMKKLKKQPRSIRTWIRNYTKYITKQRRNLINSINEEYKYTPRKVVWDMKIQNYISELLIKRIEK
jgi:hypothetical protein